MNRVQSSILLKGLANGRLLSALPQTRCLSFLYPSRTMSRRSTRLSGGPTTSDSPATAGPSRWTSNSATNRSSTSTQSETNGSTPYLEEWTTEALQAEVKRYGFKVSRKRATLIDQLKSVYEALRRSKIPFEQPSDVAQDTPPPMYTQAEQAKATRTKWKLVLPEATADSIGKGKGKGRKSDPFVLDDISCDSSSSSSVSVLIATNGGEEEPRDYTAQLELEAASATDGELSPPLSSVSSSPSSRLSLSASASPTKPRRRRSHSTASSSSADAPLSTLTAPPEDESAAVDPSLALAETMTTAIRSDPSVWSRILRYEPISFDEVVSIATQSGLAMDTGRSKEELRTWLDRQCICFYSAELIGSRSRH